MPIPAITPYAIPAADLDANRASWRPDPRRCALLVHDMQQYFLDAYDPAQEPVPELCRNIGALREMCAAQGVPVLYSVQPGDQDPAQRGLLADFWGKGMSDEPAHTRVVDAVAPAPDDVLITKWRYSAFQRTELSDVLRFLGRDQLIITGVYAHLGCLTTATEAFMRDIQPFFVADAVADFTRAEHEMAIDYAARRCASVATTQVVVDAFAAAHSA